MNGEHVQPVQSIGPGRGGGDRRTVVAALAPIVLLVTIVAGAVLGRSDDDTGTETAARPTAAPTAAAASSPAPNDPARDTAAARLADDAAFPPDTVGLPVRSVERTVMRYRAGRMRERVAAVAGWLTILPSGRDCGEAIARDVDPPTPCIRDTALLDSPAPLFALEGGRIERVRVPEIHLRPQVLPGVPIRGLAARQYRGLDPRFRPVPVVVVGRFDDPRLPACHADGRHCERFAVERIVWAGGEWQEPRPVETVAAAAGGADARERRRLAGAAVAGGGAVLSEILVPRRVLAAIDPEADTLVDPTLDGPVWYVRMLIRVAGPGGRYPRDVGWAVIDDATAAVLAANPASPGLTASR